MAAPPINDVCPGAVAVLSSVSFPLDIAPSVSQGAVELDFTVRTDGTIADAAVHSSTDPAFEASALQAISKFTCTAQPADLRVRLPIDYKRPLRITPETCPNFELVMSQIEYPRAARSKGFDAGSVVIEFPMKADGSISEFRVLRSTHETFTAAAVLALAKVKCVGVGRDVTVRVPFGFRLQ